MSRNFRTSPDRVSGWLVDLGGLRVSGNQALREPSKLDVAGPRRVVELEKEVMR